VAWLRRRLDVSDPRGFWLTFTVAIGAFATWAFVALTLDVVGHHDAALFDPRVERWVGTHRVAWVTTVMKTVTRLGSSVAIVPLLIAVAVILIARRRDWRSCLFLAAAVLGAVALYSIVKPAVDRTRPLPSMWIGRFGGDAFPSGHATLVTAFYGMVAVVLSIGRRARARVFLWTGAALITLLVGASPIYLGGHWFTDVLGGYALGAAWTAILVALMLLTTRQETAEPLAVTEVRESIAAQREGER
jgi:undecaprenyl-diphosphatase